MFRKLFRNSIDPRSERTRKAALTSLMNLTAQAISVLTGLISIPLSIDYVGVEQFGIWMALSSAMAFITFSDLGIGIGAQDRISRYWGGADFPAARSVFYTSFAFATLLLTLLFLAGTLLIPLFDLASFLALKTDNAIAAITPTTQMMVLVFAIGLPAGIIQRTFNALQEGFWTSVIQLVMRLASLGLLFVVIHYKMGLPALVFVVGGLSSAGLLAIGLPLLLVRHHWLHPDARSIRDLISLSRLKELLRTGAIGLGATIAIYVVNNSIPTLIATKYGAENVADLSIILRITSIPTLMLTYLLLPLWPAITEAKASGDTTWITRVYQKSRRITLMLCVLSSTLVILFGRAIIEAWTNNPQVAPSHHLIFACVAFMILGFWNTLTSVLLNGLSRYRGQATYGLAISIIFACAANYLSPDLPKEIIVWLIAGGYLLRCILMQAEASNALRTCANTGS